MRRDPGSLFYDILDPGKAARTADQCNLIDLEICYMLINDRCDFFYYRLDYRKQFFMVLAVALELFRFLETIILEMLVLQ